MVKSDLIGKKFGRWTVIEEYKEKSNYIMWKCLCDCGTEKIVNGGSLRSGQTKSCGCFMQEELSKRSRLPDGVAALQNKYTHYLKNARKRKYEFTIDIQEFENLIKDNCYFCSAPPELCFKPKSIRNSFPMNGIDRLDNNKGYISGNCVTACRQCNLAKFIYSEEEFKSWIKRLYKNYIQEPEYKQAQERLKKKQEEAAKQCRQISEINKLLREKGITSQSSFDKAFNEYYHGDENE